MTNRKFRVLLADRGEHIGQPCAAVLRAHGFEVELVEKDGRKLLEHIAAEPPDAVIMDFFLPQLDAVGVIREVRRMELPARPLLAVMSAFDNPNLEQEAIQAGADYFLPKPFDAAGLAVRLQTACAGRSRPLPHTDSAADTAGVEMQVSEILHQIGVPAHIKGYRYLRDAILLAIADGDIINAVTKRLYPSVAEHHDTTPSRVERAIRHAIEVAWDRGDVEVLNGYFGYTVHTARGKPTNSEFIAMIADRFRLQLKIG